MNLRGHYLVLAIFLSAIILPHLADALPFNDDMVDTQLRAGAIMRPKPEGSVAKGTLERFVDPATAANLVNPKQSSRASVESGEMLFSVNCMPCHGDIKSPQWQTGPVGQKFSLKQPPDISSGQYKSRTDGQIFTAIHFGAGLMRPVGWKLSMSETWDIVNYVRKVQGSKG
ncbi:MAG: c-type cytochrome [Bdellovibrionales bacterium]|nr:c-type cytochrome [Bdellovibrionales bacterium]